MGRPKAWRSIRQAGPSSSLSPSVVQCQSQPGVCVVVCGSPARPTWHNVWGSNNTGRQSASVEGTTVGCNGQSLRGAWSVGLLVGVRNAGQPRPVLHPHTTVTWDIFPQCPFIHWDNKNGPTGRTPGNMGAFLHPHKYVVTSCGRPTFQLHDNTTRRTSRISP